MNTDNSVRSPQRQYLCYKPWRVSHVLQETKLSLHGNPDPLEVVYVVDGPSTSRISTWFL